MGCGGSRADAIEPRYYESWTRETESTWLTNTDSESPQEPGGAEPGSRELGAGRAGERGRAGAALSRGSACGARGRPCPRRGAGCGPGVQSAVRVPSHTVCTGLTVRLGSQGV